jgi:protein-S-isoprenylcysteine O-methyltransferase Ste14
VTSTTIVIAIIGIITALLSCFTAFMNYRREKQKNTVEIAPLPNLKLLKFRQQLPKSEIAKILKVGVIIMSPFALGFLALSLWLVYEAPSFFRIISVGFWGLCLWSYVFQLRIYMRRVDEPSRVRREMQLIIDGDYDTIFDRCEHALRKIGASIVGSDRDMGMIHARVGMSWRSVGERVEIKLLKSENADCIVTLVSDSELSITLLDYGKNSQNLDALIKYL